MQERTETWDSLGQRMTDLLNRVEIRSGDPLCHNIRMLFHWILSEMYRWIKLQRRFQLLSTVTTCYDVWVREWFLVSIASCFIFQDKYLGFQIDLISNNIIKEAVSMMDSAFSNNNDKLL